MAEAPTPVEVFCSYTREDELWLRKLEIHLSLLQRQGLISLWHDRLITPGTDWAKIIDAHLETASVILLLVSSDFFASDYCYGIEMKRALERQEVGEARVVPILVRPVDWTDAPFAHLQALPTDAKPIATWRDKDTALADVAAGIRRMLEDVPLLAASAPRAVLPGIWNIPYQRNPFFLGREAEMALLRRHLQVGQTIALSQPQAISGLGGIGKTQIAIEYAYRYHREYQVILWALADSRESLIAAFSTIAKLLHLPEQDEQDQEIVLAAVKRWLMTHTKWLLILDNADELLMLPDFLPSACSGHILLTTRASAIGKLAQRIEIDALAPESGALFLLRRAGLLTSDAPLEQASTTHVAVACEIVQEMGGLPLAIDQAGAYIEEVGCSLANYKELYQIQRAALLSRRGGIIADHREPVSTTWSLSFTKVEQKNPAAADLLRLCAFLHPDAIPEEMITEELAHLRSTLSGAAMDPLTFNEVIATLRAYSLIQRNELDETISMHRLVQAVLKDDMSEDLARQWAERAVQTVNQIFPDVEYGTSSQCERYLAHAQLCAELILEENITSLEARRLLSETGCYLREHARYNEALPLFQRALAMDEQQLGPDHPDIASDLGDLANLFGVLEKYQEALPLQQRALTICEQQLGPDHPNTAVCLNGLADLYYHQGKYEEALPLFQRALTIKEQQFGPDHPTTAASLNGLANLYSDLDQYDKALPLFQRALTIEEQQLGPDHPEIALSLNNLALLYYRQCKYEEALPLFQRALTIKEQQLGPRHPSTVASLNNLAGLYYQLGEYDQTLRLYQRAMAICEQQLGPHHPSTVASLNNLAMFYDQRDLPEQALPLYLRALTICEQHLGPDHLSTAASLSNLALFYWEQVEFAQALPLLQRALAIREQQLGPDHPSSIQTHKNHALLMQAMDEHEKVEARVEDIWRRFELDLLQQLNRKKPTKRGNFFKRWLQRYFQ